MNYFVSLFFVSGLGKFISPPLSFHRFIRKLRYFFSTLTISVFSPLLLLIDAIIVNLYPIRYYSL